MKTLLQYLEEDRAAKGIDMPGQAKAIGLSVGHISRLANGKATLGLESAQKIAAYLGIDAQEVIMSATVVPTDTKLQFAITSGEFMMLAKASEAMGMPLPLSLAADMVTAHRLANRMP